MFSVRVAMSVLQFKDCPSKLHGSAEALWLEGFCDWLICKTPPIFTVTSSTWIQISSSSLQVSHVWTLYLSFFSVFCSFCIFLLDPLPRSWTTFMWLKKLKSRSVMVHSSDYSVLKFGPLSICLFLIGKAYKGESSETDNQKQIRPVRKTRDWHVATYSWLPNFLRKRNVIKKSQTQVQRLHAGMSFIKF